MDNGYEITVIVSEDQIKRAIRKSGTLDSWKLEYIINSMVEKEFQKIVKKCGFNIQQVVEKVVAETDWNQTVHNYIKRKFEDNGYE